MPKGKLTEYELRALLVASDLAESEGFRSVAVRLLHLSSHRRTLPAGPSRELLSRGLA